MITIPHMIATGVVIAMIGVPSHGDIQIVNHGVGVFVLQEQAEGGEPDWSSVAQLEMGTVTASVGSNPSGTAWAGLDWLEDGTGFQFTNGFEHGNINDSFTTFEARMESMINFVLDEPMQIDYSYELNSGGSEFSSLHGSIDFFSDPGGLFMHSFNDDFSIGNNSLILDPGTHRISTVFIGQTYLGMQGSGEMSVDMAIRFTPLPAPGALALLGLAGCAAHRRRRRE